MYTYSLCMIVKNEEAVLARCLDSFASLFDEIVIVDTGSDDRTTGYTDRLYDFAWCDDFSAARNFAFSKCTCDYIYSCDADEVLDEPNRKQFAVLQDAMLPEIEIVQMKYIETGSTVLNAKSEWRPKLFKRLRTFTWIDPVHETIRLDPIVFDSDIEISHRPAGGAHGSRDFSIFQKAWQKGTPFSAKLYAMYARELFKCGRPSDFADAIPVFSSRLTMPGIDSDARQTALAVLCRACRMTGDAIRFLQYALEASLSGTPICSELHYELGQYYQDCQAYAEAISHYSAAVYECAPLIDIHTAGDLPLLMLADCAEASGDLESAAAYRQAAKDWELPEGD